MKTSIRTTAALLLMALSGAGASAHSKLEMSDPANGAQLAAPPSALKFRFNEPVEPAMSTVKLIGPGGRQVVLDKAHGDVDANGIAVGIPKLDAGDYRAQWATSGRDGHRVKGEIKFSVK